MLLQVTEKERLVACSIGVNGPAFCVPSDGPFCVHFYGDIIAVQIYYTLIEFFLLGTFHDWADKSELRLDHTLRTEAVL